MVNGLFSRRVVPALSTLPDAAGWRLCARISLAAVAGIGMVAGLSGLVRWQPDFAGWPMRLGMILLVPAFTEELAFRGIMIPTRRDGRHDMWWLLAGAMNRPGFAGGLVICVRRLWLFL